MALVQPTWDYQQHKRAVRWDDEIGVDAVAHVTGCPSRSGALAPAPSRSRGGCGRRSVGSRAPSRQFRDGVDRGRGPAFTTSVGLASPQVGCRAVLPDTRAAELGFACPYGSTSAGAGLRSSERAVEIACGVLATCFHHQLGDRDHGCRLHARGSCEWSPRGSGGVASADCPSRNAALCVRFRFSPGLASEACLKSASESSTRQLAGTKPRS